MGALPPVVHARLFCPLFRLLGVFSLLFCAACAVPKTPDLLDIESVGPPTLEPDSEMRILGSGFPEGRPGTVRLQGVAHAPARPPREIDWELPLAADSRTAIFLRPSTRQLQTLTEGAQHVTFRGSAQVSFHPLVDGRPPLRGSKKDLVLDIFTPGGATEDSTPFLEYLGIEVSDDLVVSELASESIADAAGLQVGDRLHELDGVRLDSTRDLLPQARSKVSVLVYSRPGYSGRASAHIDRGDFQLMDSNVAARALSVAAGIALALLWVARPPRFLIWLFGDKARGRRGRIEWLPGVAPGAQFFAYPVFLGAVVALFWLEAGLTPRAEGYDFIGILAAGSLLALFAAFLLGGARTSREGFSLLGAFNATILRLLVLVPAFIAALVRASDAGSLRLREIAADQGVLPLGWGLFESPFSFLLGLSFVVALVPISGRRAPLEGHPGPRGKGVLFARLCEWAGHVVLLGLWILLYLGASPEKPGNFWMSGALLSAKLALVVHAIAWVRARTGYLRLNESWGLCTVANMLVSIGAAALGLGLLVFGLADQHAELLGLFSAALCTSLLVLLFVSSQRSWAHMGRRIDPWI